MSKRSLVWVVLGGSFVGIFAFSTSHFTVSYLVRLYGLSISQAAQIFGLIIGIGAAIGIFMGGFLADKLSTKHPRALTWLPAIGVAGSIPIYILGFYQAALPIAVVLLFLATVLHYLNFTPMYATAQNVAEPRMRATASALVITIVTLVGYGFGPPIVGAIADMASQNQLSGLGITPELCLVAAASKECLDAGGYGLRIGFLAALSAMAIGSFCYWRAGRTLIEDYYEQPAFN